MKKRQRFQIMLFISMFILDIAGLMLAFELAYRTRFEWSAFIQIFPVIKGFPLPALYHRALIALLPIWLLILSYTGLYHDTTFSAYDEFVRILKAICICSLVTTAFMFAYGQAEYSRLVIALWFCYSLILIYLLREINKILFKRMLFWSSGPQRILIIGKGKAAEAVRQMAADQPHIKTFFLETVHDVAELETQLHREHILEVLILQGAVTSQTLIKTSHTCERQGIACRIVPDMIEMRRGEIVFDGFLGLPTFQLKSMSLHGSNYYLKRGFDVTMSLLIVGILFLPLALISLLIYLDSPGPIFYTQDRVGLRGKHFKLYKFRTMIVNAHDMIDTIKHLSDRRGPVFKMRNDPRVTRVGYWLRRFSLDEIPQILNVLKGDMSLVGPRPQVLWEAMYYDDHAKKRLHVLPGITGLWQVSGRAALSYEEMIHLDIFYLENWTLGLDLKILLRTLPAVFAGSGAY